MSPEAASMILTNGGFKIDASLRNIVFWNLTVEGRSRILFYMMTRYWSTIFQAKEKSLILVILTR